MTEAPSPCFVILRHCVGEGKDGLSPLQSTLRDCPAPIRVASAPTGAGKTYAFQKLLVEAVANGASARILFIAPTRRLAQNLRAGVVDGLLDAGAAPDRATAEAMAPLWSSDGRLEVLARDPDADIGAQRKQEFRGEKSVMIFATPESVGLMLLNPGWRGRVLKLDEFASYFDHVVFDEFHTIDPRGLGLAAALARLLVQIAPATRLSFLSATPIDIIAALSAFDIPIDRICVAQETVITGQPEETLGLRPLHGDVTIRFEPSETMTETLESHRAAVRECLASGRQVVAIFDSLAALNQERAALAAWFDGVGVPAARRLAINSIDDSAPQAAHDGLFASDRAADPRDFDALLATSSIEMGVTFRAGALFMDPGHDPTSFVQRIGRVARGDKPGLAVVRIAPAVAGRKPWLRALCRALPADGRGITVEAFLDAALASARRRFEGGREAEADAPPHGYFRTMPARAVWCAAVFWAALENVKELRMGGKRALREFRPAKAGFVMARLIELKKSGLQSAEAWREAFLREARRMRMIEPKIDVLDSNGARRSVSWSIFARTPALLASPAVPDPDDKSGEKMLVLLNRPISAALAERFDGSRPQQVVEALFPHDRALRPLPAERLSEAWLTEARSMADASFDDAKRQVLETAITLVRLSGIVPSEEAEALSETGGTMIL